MFFQKLLTDPQHFVWWILIAVFSVCLHELFHALAAWQQGDTTAKDSGYLTMNPLVHMGGASLLMLFLTGVCWGACPVDRSRFRHRYGDAWVAFAGPLANLLLMVIFALLCLGTHAVQQYDVLPTVVSQNLARFFQVASTANAAFFLFNLIPLPPLDGHAIVGDFFPETKAFYAQLGNAGYVIIFLMMALPLGLGKAFWGLANMLAGSSFYLFASVFPLHG